MPTKLCIAMAVLAYTAVALLGVACADATDDYPIPHRMIITPCTAEQILGAARDFTPVYYERYIIDKHNRPPDIQQAAVDRIHWFFSLDAVGRRQYSEDTATNVYYEQMATHWGNWAKIFFNNKGVVAKETDNCAKYPPDDMSVWDG